MRSEVPLLSKSDYIAGLHCPKRLYLRKYHRDLEAPPSEGGKARMADGQEIGALARKSFPGGILIEAPFDEAAMATRVMMETAHTVFEAQFQAEGRVAKVDVLVREGDAWRVIEVKSSKEPKEDEKYKRDHLEDLAFQVLVLREAGVKVSGASLMLLSRDYVFQGNITPDLFKILDCTTEIEKLLVDANLRSMAMQDVVSKEEPPEIETNVHCTDCGFHAVCHTNQQIDDLVFMPRIKREHVTDLRKRGITRIGDIDNGFKMSPQQVTVRNVFRDGKPYIGDGLADAMKRIVYPVHFIDFESSSWAMPIFAGTTCHQAIPFQWSCHTLASPGAEISHAEFLHRYSTDPRESFSLSLWEKVKDGGSIMVYSSFEMTRLRELNRTGIPQAAELCAALADRGVDLLKIVQDHVYYAEFRGSHSIKRVLPVLVPRLSYEDLQIKEGDAASAEFKRMVSTNTSLETKDEIAENLLAYCERDTFAMVEIFKALLQISGVTKPVVPDDTKHDQLALNI